MSLPTKADLLATLEPMECSICILPFYETHQPVKTSCHHIFGARCLKKWLAEANTCPYCRAVLCVEEFWEDGESIADLFEDLGISMTERGHRVWSVSYGAQDLLVEEHQLVLLRPVRTLSFHSSVAVYLPVGIETDIARWALSVVEEIVELTLVEYWHGCVPPGEVEFLDVEGAEVTVLGEIGEENAVIELERGELTYDCGSWW